MPKQAALAFFQEDAPQNWSTPQWLYDDCELRFAGPEGFILDTAAEEWNAKAPFYFDVELDGLERDWTVDRDTRVNARWFAAHGMDALATEAFRARYIGRRDIAVWNNMPFDDIERWIRKARDEVQRGSCRLTVHPPPARVDKPWWKDIVEPFAWHRESVYGRVQFDAPPGVKLSSPFEATAIVVFAQPICARS